MNSRGAPERVRRGHPADQGFDLAVDGRATTRGSAGKSRPVFAKATPLPPQDGVWGHDYKGPSPSGPDAGQRDPEQAITAAQWRPGDRSLMDRELLAQGQVLECKLAVAADEVGKKSIRRSRSVIIEMGLCSDQTR